MRKVRLRAALAAALTTVITTGLAVLSAPGPALAIPPECDVPQQPSSCTGPIHHDPEGELRGATRVPGGVRVTGWATDADGGPVAVALRIGQTEVATLTADQFSADLGEDSFNRVIPAVAGTSVCATARNIGAGTDVEIGCVDVAIGFEPFGSLDELALNGATLTVRGWAIDPDTAEQIAVDVFYDSELVASLPAGVDRPDVAQSYPAYGGVHGYQVNVAAKGEGYHTVCVRGRHFQGVGGPEQDTQLGCRSYSVRHNPEGVLTTVERIGRNVYVRGYASDPDDSWTGVTVRVTVDGVVVRESRTEHNKYYFSADFAYIGSPGEHTVCVYALNLGLGTDILIECRPITVPWAVAAPTMTIGEVTSTSVEVTWTSTDPNVVSFRVEHTADGAWGPVGTYPQWQHSQRFDGLGVHTPHCYRVMAVGYFSEASSAAICVTTPDAS
ncbi:fibronectin type III domain-containing protein [Dactylosporangium sp. NPDC049525]|uniref:fibronectin type III domain-containing protein n=1 Tax=Dactylosporangium sp. NPDC049525 TaxID=3154730 RepID=UPI00343A1772